MGIWIRHCGGWVGRLVGLGLMVGGTVVEKDKLGTGLSSQGKNKSLVKIFTSL